MPSGTSPAKSSSPTLGVPLRHLLGRYMSLYGLAFTAALALDPAVGGEVLATSPGAVWWAGALASVLAGALLLGLRGRIPDPLDEVAMGGAAAA